MPTAKNTVKMVAHHRIAQNFNAHDSREKLHPLPNELSSLLVVGTGQRIIKCFSKNAMICSLTPRPPTA